MHKIKTAIDGLKKHLHRDTTGIALLGNVATIANELRTRAAASAENEAEAQRIANILRKESRELSMKVTRLEEDVEREQSARASQLYQIAKQATKIDSLEKLLVEETPELEVPKGSPWLAKTYPIGNESFDAKRHRGTADVRQWVAMVNALRREMRLAPLTTRWAKPNDRSLYVYELVGIIKDYSGAECLKLGRFVAAMAMANMPCVIESEANFPDMRLDGSKVIDDKSFVPFLKWFGARNIDTTILRTTPAARSSSPKVATAADEARRRRIANS